MIVGILSESHGSAPRTAAAAKLLQAEHVDAVIHCGDIGSESVLVELAAIFEPEAIPVYVVLGNVDLYHDALPRFPASAGVHVLGRQADLTLQGKRVAVVHGDDPLALRRVTGSGRFDYVFTGHTHLREDTRRGATRIINPGAVYRAAEPSVAVLDLDKDELRFLPLPPAG